MLLKFFNPLLDWYEEAKFHLYKSKQVVRLACSATLPLTATNFMAIMTARLDGSLTASQKCVPIHGFRNYSAYRFLPNTFVRKPPTWSPPLLPSNRIAFIPADVLSQEHSDLSYIYLLKVICLVLALFAILSYNWLSLACMFFPRCFSENTTRHNTSILSYFDLFSYEQMLV